MSYLAVTKVWIAGQLHERDTDGIFIKVKGSLGEGFILVGTLTSINSLWAKLHEKRRCELTQLVDVDIFHG